MTNYEEEQRQELEALSAIYPGEIEVDETEFPFGFQITLTGNAEKLNETLELSCSLQVTYTDTYPDSVPLIELTGLDNAGPEDLDRLLEALNEEAENNLGMVMAFTLISVLQEKLNCLAEDILENRQSKEDEARIIADALEAKKMEGTKVTVESFLAWKAEFDQDRLREKQKIIESQSKKLTGRQQFLEDATLNISDIGLLEASNAENMQIDESLFEDLDDLDLEDDDEDDEAD